MHAAEVGAGVEQVSGEAVPEFVRREIGRDAGVREIALHREPHRAGTEATAAFVDEKGPGIYAGGVAVFLDRVQSDGSDGHDALLAALAKDANAFAVGIDVAHIESGEFGEAQAAAVKEFEDGGVALRHPRGCLIAFLHRQRRGEEGVDLFGVEDDGEFLVQLGKLNLFEWVVGEGVALGEKAVECAQGGEVEANGRLREAGFHLLEQVTAKMVRLEFAPRW